MIDIAVVSAAGRGTRMKELTKERPKHLIEVNGRPFISYLLDNIVAAGFKKIVLVVGHNKEKFDDFLSQYNYPVKVIEQPMSDNDDYGTAIPIKYAQPEVGDNQFVAVAGDHYFTTADLKKLVIDDKLNYIGAAKVDDPRQYGVAQYDSDGFLEKIVEKPENPASSLVNVSLYKFQSEVFSIINSLDKSPRGEYEITDALNKLAETKKVKVIEVEKFYLDFGRPDDIKRMEKILE
ncbi:MAG: sugar phosphate nucleotidyltransferase [Patescibacteria group bacterium]